MLRIFKVEDRKLKRHKSIGVFVVYIDTGSSMPISPSKSRDLAVHNIIRSCYSILVHNIISLTSTARIVLLHLSTQYHKFNFDNKDRVAQS